jgi:hypothetical protein
MLGQCCEYAARQHAMHRQGDWLQFLPDLLAKCRAVAPAGRSTVSYTTTGDTTGSGGFGAGSSLRAVRPGEYTRDPCPGRFRPAESPYILI